MCACIDIIKASYSEVQRQTAKVVEQPFDMDAFLDRINDIQKELAEVTDDIHGLVELVRSHFTELTIEESEELLHLSAHTMNKMDELYLKLLRSPYYVGMKTSVERYQEGVSDFKELCNDLKSFNIDLRRDEVFQATLQQLSSLIRK